MDSLPLWLVFLATIGIVMLSIVLGVRAGLWVRNRKKDPPEAPIGSIVGALLGLLAFILTFTFSMASSRFDARRQLLLEEVNAIGTTALRAEMLPEPERSAILELFRKYVSLRVEAMQHPEMLRDALAASEVMQDQLWMHAVSVSTRINTPITALFVSSLNEVIDLQTSRKTVAFLYRIPGAIWVGLVFVTVFTMAVVGFEFGMSGKAHWGLGTVLAVTFSTVILLITLLDRPNQDIIRVNQGAMIELQQKLNR